MSVPLLGFNNHGEPVAMPRDRAKHQEVAGKLFIEANRINDEMAELAAQAKSWQLKWEEAESNRDATIAVLYTLGITQEEAIGWVRGTFGHQPDLKPIITREEHQREMETLAKAAEVSPED